VHGIITEAEELFETLTLGMKPEVDLSEVKEAMTNNDAGFSFLEIEDNNLKDGAAAMLSHLNDMDLDDERNLIHGPTGLWHGVRVDSYMAAKQRFLTCMPTRNSRDRPHKSPLTHSSKLK